MCVLCYVSQIQPENAVPAYIKNSRARKLLSIHKVSFHHLSLSLSANSRPFSLGPSQPALNKKNFLLIFGGGRRQACICLLALPRNGEKTEDSFFHRVFGSWVSDGINGSSFFALHRERNERRKKGQNDFLAVSAQKNDNFPREKSITEEGGKLL